MGRVRHIGQTGIEADPAACLRLMKGLFGLHPFGHAISLNLRQFVLVLLLQVLFLIVGRDLGRGDLGRCPAPISTGAARSPSFAAGFLSIGCVFPRAATNAFALALAVCGPPPERR